MIPSTPLYPPNGDLLLLVGRMDGKLDLMLAQSTDHGTRIAILEAWRNRVLGLALAVGGAAGATASQIKAMVAMALSGH